MKDRVKRIFANAKEPLDAVVIMSSVEPLLDKAFFYLTDVPSGLFEGCIAVGFPDGSLTVFSSPLETESARVAPDVTVETFTTRADQSEKLRKLLPKSLRVGLNFHDLTHENFLHLKKELPYAEIYDVTDPVRKARAVKDANEIERLRHAGKIVSRAAEAIPSLLRNGMTELELAAEVEAMMNKFGAAGRSFDTIVGFGAHSAEPHFAPTSTRLEKGMGIVCDFGALYQRYCSDLTRSFAFGQPPAELKAVHRAVEEAQRAALDVIKAGVPGREPHLAAAKLIDGTRWKGLFNHGLGHSVGLAVHDGFSMNPRTEENLEAGMVITVEPGIYVNGLGGVRIEDDVLVTEKGYEFLTTAPREYFEVGSS
jgi:Xaa-Pro dipeptidase